MGEGSQAKIRLERNVKFLATTLLYIFGELAHADRYGLNEGLDESVWTSTTWVLLVLLLLYLHFRGK